MGQSRANGAALAGIGTLLAGSSFAAGSLLTRYPFFSGQAVRFALGGVGLVVIALLARARWPLPTTRELALLALLAATGLVGFNLACLASLRYSEPAALGVVVGCAPLVVVLLGPLTGSRRPSRPILLAALIVVLGAAVVQGFARTTAAGFGFAVLALLGEVAFTLLAVPVLPRLGPMVVSTWVCGLAAVEMALLTVVIEVTRGELRTPTTKEALALAYLAIAVTALAFVTYYAGLQRLGPERTSLFAGLIPVTAALAGPVVGTGTLGPAQVLGSVIVGVGISVGMAVPAPAGTAEIEAEGSTAASPG